MKLYFITIILFFNLSCPAQKNKNYLLSYIDTCLNNQLVGFKTVTGKIVIKAKYWAIGYDEKFPEKMYKAACVYGDSGWIFINRKDSIILTPYIYDNGPDYTKEGLFRFVENKKIGFADKKFKKVISAKYSFATPFEQGLAAYFIGGEKIYGLNKTAADIIAENGSFSDRHWVWTGATITERGSINKKGEEFMRVSKLKNNIRQAW